MLCSSWDAKERKPCATAVLRMCGASTTTWKAMKYIRLKEDYNFLLHFCGGYLFGPAAAEPAPASGTGTSAVPGTAKYTADEIAMRKAADLPVD